MKLVIGHSPEALNIYMGEDFVFGRIWGPCAIFLYQATTPNPSFMITILGKRVRGGGGEAPGAGGDH